MEQFGNGQSLVWRQLSDAEAVGAEAASLVARQLAQKPDSILVFPTGKTPLPLYAGLRQMPQVHWEQSRLFQLDEYVAPTGPLAQTPEPYERFAQFMERELWGHVAGKKYYLQDYLQNLAGYEALLSVEGGPDLVILGIGANGHVAFNEPGSAMDSRTRVVDLTPLTLQNNFGCPDVASAKAAGFPVQAVTLGLKNILSAKQVLLLATGAGKQAIVERAFSAHLPPSLDCPASWLKQHSHLTLLTDFSVSTLA